MLYEAFCWQPEAPKQSKAVVFSSPEISHYVEGWGRPKDASVVALDSRDGAKIGAAWYRLMSPEDPGYGFIDAATPEVSIAVVPRCRGKGVGRALLGALMDTARSEGFRALSLSVAQDNPAIKLYEQAGFGKVHLSGGSWTMRTELSGRTDTTTSVLSLTVLEERLSICRLDAGEEIPAWATGGPFFSVTRTRDELSVVCPEDVVPESIRREWGWRALKLEGPFDLSMVGVLTSVAVPLAEAGASIFAVSTFDTDYVLVRKEQLDLAVDTLWARGHRVGDHAAGGR
jgi:GNAT superfamily N-acetyltransferase